LKEGVMKIIVDRDLCEANGVCTSWAPEVFLLDDKNRMVLAVERPGPELGGKIQQAVGRCPRGALSVVDDG
jgi:ferredoxin